MAGNYLSLQKDCLTGPYMILIAYIPTRRHILIYILSINRLCWPIVSTCHDRSGLVSLTRGQVARYGNGNTFHVSRGRASLNPHLGASYLFGECRCLSLNSENTHLCPCDKCQAQHHTMLKFGGEIRMINLRLCFKSSNPVASQYIQIRQSQDSLGFIAYTVGWCSVSTATKISDYKSPVSLTNSNQQYLQLISRLAQTLTKEWVGSDRVQSKSRCILR